MIVTFTGPTISFPDPPKRGDGFERDGQTYIFVSKKPHIRKDGVKTTLLIWQTHCADCGDQFQITTGLVGVRPPNRRCEPHRSAFVPATNAAAAKQKSGKKRWRVANVISGK